MREAQKPVIVQKGKVPIPPPNSSAVIKAAKNAEYQGVFNALKKEFDTSFPSFPTSPPTPPHIDASIRQTLVHAIAREQKKNGQEPDLDKLTSYVNGEYEKNGKKYKNIPDTFESCNHLPNGISQEWMNKTLKSARKNKGLAEKNLQSQIKSLHSTLLKLHVTIANGSKDPRKAVKESLSLMRKAQQSEAYIFLRNDEANPDIHFLHSMALACLMEPTPLDAYTKLGVVEETQSSENSATTQQPSSFSQSLSTLRDKGIKAGYHSSHSTAEFLFEHPMSTIRSMASSTGIGVYDPRASGNLTGTLYRETLTRKDTNTTQVHRRTVYTPTPTSGTSVTPETRLVLQALENRHFMAPEDLKKNHFPYKNWVYTNLQDIHSSYSQEGKRSRAIMQLNTEFPLSFTGISISADSPFYKDGVSGGETKDYAKKKEKSAAEPWDRNYYKKMLDDLNSSYYSFPVQDTKAAQDEWESHKNQIVETAFKIIDAITVHQNLLEADKNEFLWNKKAAFRELVMLGIIRYWQCKGSQGNSDNILCTNACKECIDRGGMKNAALLWALGGKRDDVLKALLGRSLLARYRLILPDRLEPFIGLVKIIESGGTQTASSMRTFLREGVDNIAQKNAFTYANPEAAHASSTIGAQETSRLSTHLK